MRWMMIFGLAACLGLSTTSSAQDLEYRWTSGQKFSYEIEIVVSTNDEKITYKGMTHYTVDNAGQTQNSLTFRGGLRESKQAKQQRRPRGFPMGAPFGPRGFVPPPSPFSRTAFAGKTQTTNRMTLSTRGEVLAMEGDSQLPYLIGNVSILPFEPLPKSSETKWSYDSGISITEEDEQEDAFGPFGPRGPLGPRGRFGPFGQVDPRTVQAAGEGATYRIERTDENLVVIEKDYYLNTPKTDENNVFKMRGKGTWTFDTADHVPHAYDMAITLSVESGNTTTAIPITIKYARISAEKLAAMEAEAKRKAEEAARIAAEKKAFAETPLTADEKKQTLKVLASATNTEVLETLNQLAAKSLANPDPEVAEAIRGLIKSPNAQVATAADKALRSWSAEYASQKKLQKAYQGPAPVKSTGLVVESTTPLFVGQIVQAQRPRYGSFWRPARVKDVLNDGTVMLAFLSWGKERDRDVVAVMRRNIELAPPELEQPAFEQPAASDGNPAVVSRPMSTNNAAISNNEAASNSIPKENSTSSTIRTWSDVSGRFKVQASFVEVIDGKVRLKRADGKLLAPLPLEKLSEADRQFVKQQQLGNPFQVDGPG